MLRYNSDHLVTVALVSLAQSGMIDCGESLVEGLLRSGTTSIADLQVRRPLLPDAEFAIRAIAGAPPVSDPVERAVYGVVARTPVRGGNVAAIRAEAAPVVGRIVQERLERRGLRRGDAGRAVATQRLLVVLSVVALATVVYALVAARSTGNWYGLILAALVAVLVWACAALLEDLTLRGWLRLTATGWRYRRPMGIGKPKAPLGHTPELSIVLALYGELFLWRYDPALAVALGLEHISDLEGWGGG